MEIKITRITIIGERHGPDYVYLITDLPSPMPGLTKDPLDLRFSVEYGKGEEYVKTHFPGTPFEKISSK